MTQAIDEIFEGDNWAGLHDVILDTLDTQPTKNQVRTVFDKLPERVQAIALKWGLQDTVFRDEAYEAIETLGIDLK